ncbi:MAG TPA: hypothetical protein VF656_00775 [Pyrinomonadaceae bacterium]|jgi:hypothetical protein
MHLKIRHVCGTRMIAPLVLALSLLLALTAGCNKDSNAGHSPEGASSDGAPPVANTPSTANSSSTTSTPAVPSPTDVVKGYYEAGRRKDVVGIKSYLSRQSLRLMEDVAQRQGKTLDQLFAEAADVDARKPPPVFTDERIGGSTALVDINIPGEDVRTVMLVKEAGQWKLVFGNPKSDTSKASKRRTRN